MSIPLAITAALDMTQIIKALSNITANRVFMAVATAVASLVVIKVLLTALDRAFRRSKLAAQLQKLLRALVKLLLWFVAIIAVLDRLGIQVTSLVAVLSVIGLAFSLALQNFLSNVAGGMQLLCSRPFQVGDWVEAGNCAGTVQEIGLFYTKLSSGDNKLIQLPNSSIVSANIINYSASPHRRVEWSISVSYDAPISLVRDTLTKLTTAHPLVLPDQEVTVRVSSYGDSAIQYLVRAWCNNQDYWTVYYDVMDGLKPAFDQAGIQLTYPHLNVHLTDREAT